MQQRHHSIILLLAAIALLVGSSQQLCAELGMLCAENETDRIATEETQAASCHADETAPEPEAPTAPTPEMACCQAAPGVTSAAAPMMSLEPGEVLADTQTSLDRRRFASARHGERRPAGLPPDLLQEYCILLI